MNHRILIVDDDPLICELTQITLEQTGRFEVLTETRPARAIEAAKSFRPDLIMLDVNMPGKGGSELAREMAEEPALAMVKIVFLTGSVSPGENNATFVAGGAPHYLPKTLGSQAFIEAVDELLGA